MPKTRGFITQLFFKIQQKFAQSDDRLADVLANLMKISIFFIHIFVHIYTAVDFQLQGENILARLAVIEGDKGAGIRAIILDPVVFLGQSIAEKFRHRRRTALVKQVADAEFDRFCLVHDIADF